HSGSARIGPLPARPRISARPRTRSLIGHEVAVLREPLEIALNIGARGHDPTVVAPDPVEHRRHQSPREPAPGEAFGDDRVLEFEGARVDLTMSVEPYDIRRGLLG